MKFIILCPGCLEEKQKVEPHVKYIPSNKFGFGLCDVCREIPVDPVCLYQIEMVH